MQRIQPNLEAKEPSQEALKECITNKCIETLKFMIRSGIIDVDRLFNSQIPNEKDAWFLRAIFFETGYNYSNLWESVLPCMLEVLKIKNIKPLPEKTIELLQLIACRNFLAIEHWLDAFSNFYNKQEFINITNNFIFMMPHSANIDDRYETSLKCFNKKLHKAGNNLLSSFMFYSMGRTRFTIEDIQRFFDKYSLNPDACNQVQKIESSYPPLAFWGHTIQACDMTVSYKTTFGRALNVLYGLCEHASDTDINNFILHLAECIKLLIPICDLSELESIIAWYKKNKADFSQTLTAICNHHNVFLNMIEQIKQKRDVEMKSCSHSLFHSKSLRLIINDYLSTDQPQSSVDLISKRC